MKNISVHFKGGNPMRKKRIASYIVTMIMILSMFSGVNIPLVFAEDSAVPSLMPTETIAYMGRDNPLGPFEYIGPILPGPGVFGNGDSGKNHHAIFEFEGEWYITYQNRQVNIAKRKNEGKSGHKDYRSPSITELDIDPVTGFITSLNMESKGVDRLKTMNPYTRVEAETIAWNGGISTEASTQPGLVAESINLQVNDINHGDWIAVSGLDFGDQGAGTFTANVASGSSGGEIELRIDSLDGEVIGTLPVSSTGGWDNWKTITTAVSGVTGVHDVYMIFKGQTSEELFKLDYWMFNEKRDVHELVAINATVDRQIIDITSGDNTANLNVTAVYADGTTENVTSMALATPSQTGIVEINNGIVTGVSYGTTSIHISYEGKTFEVYLEVKLLNPESKVKRLIIDNNNVTLDPGGTAEFTVTAKYLDEHMEDVTNRATYENSNPDIAEVSNGTITAKASGLVTVVVSFKGDLGDTATAQISVTVSGEEGLKPFTMITDGNLDRVSGILAEIQVSPTGGAAHDGEEVVVFQLMKGNTPVSISVFVKDITSSESMRAYFDVVDPDDPSYTVKVFILDSFNGDHTAPISLAEPVILN